MSRRAPSRPCQRTLVRTSQRNRSELPSLCRAYELALPVAHSLAQPRSAKSSSTKKRRHVA